MSVEQAAITTIWLRSYAATGSQEAFAALVRQYVNLVYTAARRQVRGDAHLADDITQAVFIVLAQRAKTVPADRPLSAWLIKVTRYCANNARRMKQNRETHERRAAEMIRDQGRAMQTDQADQASWEQELAPLLDEGLSKLRPADRDALLLKFFEQKSLREVGEALGVSEEAAQKRVARAVDRLRDFFRRRGVAASVTADSLAGLLATEAIKAAPTKLAVSIGASSAASTSTAAATLAKGAMVAMATQKTTAVVIGGLVLLLGIGGATVVVHSMTTRSSNTTTGDGGELIDLALAPAPAGNAAVTFSDGTKTECVAMSEITFSKTSLMDDLMGKPNVPLPAKSWWKPDGSPGVAPNLGNDMVFMPQTDGNRSVRLVFDTTGPSALNGSINLRLNNTGGFASSERTIGPVRRLNFAASFPESLNKINVSVGLAKGPWRTDVVTPVVTAADGSTSASTTQPSGPITYGEISNRTADNTPGCSIELLRDNLRIGDRQRSIRVTTTDGKELWCGSSQSSNGKSTYHFACPKEKLANIVWLSRGYEWGTLNGISLKPQPTAVK